MKERDLIAKIRNYLKSVQDLFFWKEHGGQYGTAGIPDVIVCYKGKFIAFEAKVGRNKTTPLQDATIKRIIKAGGYALVVRTLDEVKEIIEALAKD